MMAETSMEHENMNMPFDLPVSWKKYSQVGDVLTNLYKSIMVKGVDYDTLPGSNKPSCLKPGAELLSKVFNIRDEITGTECVEHMEGEHPYVQYRVKVTGYNGRGERISDGTGSASSLEPKYAKTMDTLLHKLQRKGENVSEINVLAGVQNTILKMAAKRAYIDMVLRATGASRIFSQDGEDAVVDATYSEHSHADQDASRESAQSQAENKPMSENQKGRILDGLKAKLNKYGDLFFEFYCRKEPVLRERVTMTNGTFTIADMSWKEASAILQNVIWQKSENDREFQEWISAAKGAKK